MLVLIKISAQKFGRMSGFLYLYNMQTTKTYRAMTTEIRNEIMQELTEAQLEMEIGEKDEVIASLTHVRELIEANLENEKLKSELCGELIEAQLQMEIGDKDEVIDSLEYVREHI